MSFGWLIGEYFHQQKEQNADYNRIVENAENIETKDQAQSLRKEISDLCSKKKLEEYQKENLKSIVCNLEKKYDVL